MTGDSSKAEAQSKRSFAGKRHPTGLFGHEPKWPVPNTSQGMTDWDSVNKAQSFIQQAIEEQNKRDKKGRK